MINTESTLQLRPAVHWTVYTNYRFRAVSFVNVFAAVLVHGWDKHYPPIVWGLIAVQLLLYPHLAYLVARRLAQSQKAEINNLTVDCLMFGMLSAALQFPLWIAFTVYIASTLNLTISQGLTGLRRSQLSFFAGMLLLGLVMRWQVSPETGWPATFLCVIGNAVYMVSIGLAAHRRNMQVRQTREALRARESTLQRKR